MPGPYRFGKLSKANREQLHPDLQAIVDIAIKYWDCTIEDAAREHAEQVKNIAKGVSKTMNTMHFRRNEKGEVDHKKGKAWAMDIRPYPIDWPAIERGLRAALQADPSGAVLEIYMFSGYIQGIAAALEIPIRSGADWDSDKDIANQSFHDLPHHEKVIDDSDGR